MKRSSTQPGQAFLSAPATYSDTQRARHALACQQSMPPIASLASRRARTEPPATRQLRPVSGRKPAAQKKHEAGVRTTAQTQLQFLTLHPVTQRRKPHPKPRRTRPPRGSRDRLIEASRSRRKDKRRYGCRGALQTAAFWLVTSHRLRFDTVRFRGTREPCTSIDSPQGHK